MTLCDGEKAGIWIAVQMRIALVKLEKELGRRPTPDEIAEEVMRH